MAPEVTVRGRNPGSPGATREGRPGSVRQPATSIDSGSAKVKRRLLTFATLPGALAEGELLVQIAGLNPTQVFSGKEATERFVKNLHGPRILHIATHGFFLPPPTEAERSTPVARETGRRQVETDEPFGIRLGVQRNPMLRSGIALAGANQGSGGDDEDGILTAEELAQLDLQGTELVVLSACETGTGDVANGEGVFGLRRALMLAGARSQLVSLWRISDQGTSQLMGEYYRALLRGMSRSRALQVAQEKLRTSVATSHPYYWSAFVPAGDWRPIGGL
jgi:CHAT domain-containing protein